MAEQATTEAVQQKQCNHKAYKHTMWKGTSTDYMAYNVQKAAPLLNKARERERRTQAGKGQTLYNHPQSPEVSGYIQKAYLVGGNEIKVVLHEVRVERLVVGEVHLADAALGHALVG